MLKVSNGVLVLCVIYMSGTGALAASSLDAPLTPQPPTIRSELKRGADAADPCTTPHAFDLTYIDHCISEAQSENRQKMGQGFEAFDTGFYFTAWLQIQTMLDADGGKGLMFNVRIAQATLKLYWISYISARGQIKITDADVVEALKLPPALMGPKIAAAVAAFGDTA